MELWDHLYLMLREYAITYQRDLEEVVDAFIRVNIMFLIYYIV